MRIGVIDSGIGGLTILKRLIEKCPDNRYLYFSDNLYAPYGNRNIDFLSKRMGEICDKAVASGADILVLGCNTAGSNLGDKLRGDYGIPVVAMVPEAYPERERTLIMCTPLTAQSAVVRNYAERGAEIYADGALASLIESCKFDLSAVYDCILPKLRSYCAESITLGCTHYIYLKEGIERALGVKCLDGTDRVVDEVERASRGGIRDSFGLRFIFSGRDESEEYLKLLYL